jgi:hypothetical protein
MKYNIRTLFPEGNGYSEVTSNYAEEISVVTTFSFVKNNAPENFWDEAISDDNEFFECELYGKQYTPAEVLRAVNREKFDEVCEQFWNEAKKDIIDWLTNLDVNETDKLFNAFEVTRIE